MIKKKIIKILKFNNIAVIGMSRDPLKAANHVPKYLIENGYKIYPVNPLSDEILG
jgi:predicted CoA-binding protein